MYIYAPTRSNRWGSVGFRFWKSLELGVWILDLGDRIDAAPTRSTFRLGVIYMYMVRTYMYTGPSL